MSKAVVDCLLRMKVGKIFCDALVGGMRRNFIRPLFLSDQDLP